MDLIIPTYGRHLRQETLRQLTDAGLSPTLVVQAREAFIYNRWQSHANIVALPDHIQTIAPTRQYILEQVGESDKLVMLDDDLTFYLRREDEPTKFADCYPRDLQGMMTLIEHELSTFPHVGIAAREGAHRVTDEYVDNTRIMRVLGYRRDVLLEERLRFDQMDVMEDFHVALSLLERGHPNRIINSYCHNQAGSGKAGGCSHFRTDAIQTKNAQLLHKLHPRFVRVTEKTTKGAWGGGTRTDVVVYWKKAYEHSANN